MFRNSRGGRSTDSLLPTSGNGRGGGGSMYGGARVTRQPLSKSFIATIAWLLVSLALIGGGYRYCAQRFESTNIQCDGTGCKVVQLKDGDISVLKIPRGHMVRADLVRVRNGKMVDPTTLRRASQRKLGHSYAVVYTAPDSEEDDDDSYDSFADDDDSFDSYDNEEDSSADDDDMDDDDRPVLISGKAAGMPNKAAAGSGKNDDKTKTKTATSSKTFGGSRSAEDRKVDEERREARRVKEAEERERRGLAPLKEPDERRRMNSNRARDGEWDDEDRFPGDAGTMKEKNREQIRRMSEDNGIAAKEHKERGMRQQDEAAKKHSARARVDAQTKQIGNNLHDRAASPDDPDERRPGLEKQQGRRDLPKDDDHDAPPDDAAEQIKNLQDQLTQLQEETNRKGGKRSISSVGGLEDFDEQDRPQTEEFVENQEADAGQGDMEFKTVADLVQAGAKGAQRKLLHWKNRVKNIDPVAPKRSKEEVARDATKGRESHRQHHGHHQKRPKKVAKPGPEDPGRPAEKTRHHHKAFHHKKDVPVEDRHHVHPGFHHKPGEEKMKGGWRHQNKQWHEHDLLFQLGTTHSLGRTKARARKELIDNYVFKRGPEEGRNAVDFTDSKMWRAAGRWLIMMGSMSMIFCFFVGNFRPRPKTKKVT